MQTWLTLLISSTLNPFSNTSVNVFLLHTPDFTEFYNAINSLNINKATGYDNTPARFLCITSSVITPYLQIFIDFCFTNGVFPTNSTIAKIVPIFEKGNREDPSNYRPISILTCYSKIFEKIIYYRFISFLNKHKVIQNTQYGFRSEVSTNHALIDVVTNIFDNINSNKYAGLIFLDLTKAFDTVNHNILLSKLTHYGIRGQANNLIRSFLNKKQYVYINEKTSTLLTNSFGVPQGSILGPLLFLLYINDLPSSVSCTPRLFADDTCLALSDKNLTSLSSQINNDLDNISGWFRVNLLTVNPSKSHALIIPPKLNKSFPAIEISINNSPISLRNNVKY